MRRLTFDEFKALLSAQPGMNCRELAAALAVTPKVASANLTNYIRRGVLFAAGERPGRRYFLSKADAEALHPLLIEANLRAKAAAQERRLLLGRQAWHARHARNGGLPRAPKYAALDTELLRLAEREDGVAAAPLLIYATDTVSDRCARLRVMGLLFSGHAGHRTVRYFRSQEKADAWAAKNKTPDRLRAERKPVTSAASRLATDAPVIERDVTPQVIPRKPGRYEVVGPIEGVITRDWQMRREFDAYFNQRAQRARSL